MAKPAKTTPAFSKTSQRRPSNLLMFPETLSRKLLPLLEMNDSTLRVQLNKLANHDPAAGPAMGQRLAGRLYYLKGANSGKDSHGIVYLHAPEKDMPTAIIGMMNYGEFVKATRNKKLTAALVSKADELMELYPDRKGDAKPEGPVILQDGYRGYHPSYGLV